MPRPKKQKPNRSDDRYEVKITLGKTLDGKTLRKSFYSTISKADAQKQADEWKIAQKVADITGEGFVSKQITFREWSLKWLEATKLGKVKEYTYEVTYRSKLEKYLIPYFGNAYLDQIRKIDIENFFSQHRQLSMSMLSKMRLILFDVFAFAIENDLCRKNPVARVKVSSEYVPKGRHTYNQEQAEALYRYCLEHQIIDILLLLKAGIRRSELLGLRWDNISFKDRCLYVLEAVTPTSDGYVLGPPKSTTSIRAVPLSDEIMDCLSNVPESERNGFLVRGHAKGYMSPTGYTHRYQKEMRAICEALELPFVTPHELRHTFGTLLHGNGTDIYTIQKAMGHADIGITAKIYVHNDLETLRKNMKL